MAKPGDIITEDCVPIDKGVLFGMFSLSEEDVLERDNAHPFVNKLALANRKDDYINHLEENDLEVCNDDFAESNKLLRLSINKIERIICPFFDGNAIHWKVLVTLESFDLDENNQVIEPGTLTDNSFEDFITVDTLGTTFEQDFGIEGDYWRVEGTFEMDLTNLTVGQGSGHFGGSFKFFEKTHPFSIHTNDLNIDKSCSTIGNPSDHPWGSAIRFDPNAKKEERYTVKFQILGIVTLE